MAGTIWYIGTGGDDANDGSRGSPFATVKAANEVVQAGDSVYFLAGEYNNASFGDGDIWKSGTDVVLGIRGVHGNATDGYITYQPEPGAAVKLKYDGGGAVRIVDSTFVRVEGFDIEGPAGEMNLEDALAAQYLYKLPDGSIRARDPDATLETSVSDLNGKKPFYWNSNAVSINAGTHHIDIVGNDIHDSPGSGISGLGGSDYLRILDNTISRVNWYNSNGGHGITFKNLTSIDDNDAAKVIISGNELYDNYTLLVSWAASKTAPVTKVLDEGKGIHIQDTTAANGWVHGQIQVSDNLIVRSGQAGLTVNGAERMIYAYNTLIDNGYINQVIADGRADPDIEAGYGSHNGGIRTSGAVDASLHHNVIRMLEGQYAYGPGKGDTALTVDLFDTIFSGGTALRNASDFADGLEEVVDLGFIDAANGDFRIADSGASFGKGRDADRVLLGGTQGDTLFSGGGDDVLRGAAGADLLHGGGGFDLADYRGSRAGVAVDLTTGAAGGGDAAGDRLEGIEGVLGTVHSDVLDGDALTNFLRGYAGNDVLRGREGADTLSGGTGADVLDGGADDDRLLGEGGADTLSGAQGNDYLNGGAGDDGANGGHGNDTLAGAGGDDALSGDAGADKLFGGAGHDALDGGTQGDWLSGGFGNDRLNGGDGLDTLLGGAGADELKGGANSDWLSGGTGADHISGGSGNDTLRGDGGGDTLQGGIGSDTLTGGEGADIFVFHQHWGSDTITDFANDGVEKLHFSGTAAASFDDLTFEDTAAGLQISVGADRVLLANGLSFADMGADDFLFSGG